MLSVLALIILMFMWVMQGEFQKVTTALRELRLSIGSDMEAHGATMRRETERYADALKHHAERTELAQRDGADRIEHAVREHTSALRTVAEQAESIARNLKDYAAALAFLGAYHKASLKLAEEQVAAVAGLKRAAEVLGTAVGTSRRRAPGVQAPSDDDAAFSESELLEMAGNIRQLQENLTREDEPL